MVRILLTLLFALSARAALITSDPGGITTTVTGPSNMCGSGPIGAFTYSSSSSAMCGPYSGFWGLGANGHWNEPPTGFGLMGVSSLTGAYTIDLGASYATVGAFVNYYLPSAGPTISAIAADGTTVLESYNLQTSAPISTPGTNNAGAFRGFTRPTADIRYFKLDGAAIAVHSITVNSSPTQSSIPEPSTFLLLSPALLFLLRRHNC